ncbi:hypothetical protein E4T80_09870 [Muribacter muris]|uniref:Uncharacterized protein n=1 Tax=Muribacter muris TaxID=67855 RepID=A0A4Y9JVR1_9PAST|nr:hypothetical protein [Muribacter muris]MBF0785765.1 hypothetical protein [Muribacter muris]MBF0828263.1 hypothetical protein [Muribacter muris]TFV08587.1 hypothetical protein E4T80_09870 [Muribacter muris]
MAVKPIYENYLNEMGCSSSSSPVPTELMQQVEALAQKVSAQTTEIQTLQAALADKVGKSELITVHSLEDEALFKAFPLTTGE